MIENDELFDDNLVSNVSMSYNSVYRSSVNYKRNSDPNETDFKKTNISVLKEGCSPVLSYSLEQHQNHELKPVSQQDSGVYVMNQHALGLNVPSEPTRNLIKQNTQLYIADQLVIEEDESHNLNKVDQPSYESVYSGCPTSVRDTGTNIDCPDSDGKCGTIMQRGYHQLKPDMVICQTSDSNCNLVVGTAEVIHSTGYSSKRKTALNGNFSDAGDNWSNNTTSEIHDKYLNEFADFCIEERDENTSAGNTNNGVLAGTDTLSRNRTALTDSEVCSSCDEGSLEETTSDTGCQIVTRWNTGPADVSPTCHSDTRWNTGPADMSPTCHSDTRWNTRPADMSPTCHSDTRWNTRPADMSPTCHSDTRWNTGPADMSPTCHSDTRWNTGPADMSPTCHSDTRWNTGPADMSPTCHSDTRWNTGPADVSPTCPSDTRWNTGPADVSPTCHSDTRWNTGPADVSPTCHSDTRWNTGPADVSPTCHSDTVVQTRPADMSSTWHSDSPVHTKPHVSPKCLGDTSVNTSAMDILPLCRSDSVLHSRLADLSPSHDNTVNTGPTDTSSACHCDTVITTGHVVMSSTCTRQNSFHKHTHVADNTTRTSRSLSLNNLGELDGLDTEDVTWGHSYSRWTIPDPGSQKLNWNKPPLTVLVVKKMFDEGALTAFKQLVMWLVQAKHMVVFVEKTVLEDNILKTDQHFQELIPKLKIFVEQRDDLTNKVDFIICLGGDGTLLYASSLFQTSVPPVMAFNLGSLGFLTPFNFENFKENVSHVLEGHASLLLRYRLKCCVSNIESSGKQNPLVNKTESSNSCRTSILVFNEVVVDRGQSSYLTNLDLYVEGRLVTSAQGDGIIISTPTGSTAYAVAAGASMVHPNVPAIVITPICPHSLSFRPVVVPAGVEIKIVVSPESRNPAWASFDGRDRQKLQPGEHVRITTAQYPVPSVCAKDQIDDWFDSLAECLHWNVRRTQKPLSSVSSVASLDSLADQIDLSN